MRPFHPILRRLALISLFTVLPAFLSQALAESSDPIGALLHRILPRHHDADRFSYRIITSDRPHDFFTLSSDGQTVRIEANSQLSVATAVNWFLQHHAGVQIGWNHMQGELPTDLPIVKSETHVATADLRYYLNFCTHSYTMPFWDWTRWEQEIDLMALHGINLPLITTGFECVWKRVLESYGYRDSDEVGTFIPGPTYLAWFYMANMSQYGGPLPRQWYHRQEQLARKIFRRLRDFDITPVVPGWNGMIPHDFLRHARKAEGWTDTTIVPTGTWNAFERPALVADTAHIAEFAKAYYEAVDHIYGDVLHTHFYALDPFHEGNVPATLQPQPLVDALYKSLLRHDSRSVWVAQCWEGNPQGFVTKTIPKHRLLLLHLNGDTENPTNPHILHTDRQDLPHDWLLGCVNNFGGNTGYFGRLRQMSGHYAQAMAQSSHNALRGIAYLPEGIENNEMLFDFLFALPWYAEIPSQEEWVQTYATMRYGLPLKENQQGHDLLTQAWQLLADGIYNCPNPRQQGATESVFLMRPSHQPGSVSTWANSSWYWSADSLTKAVGLFAEAAPYFMHNDRYAYDLVDITRQWLGDKGKLVLDSLQSSDAACRPCLQHYFLSLILDADTLLATRPEFRLGHWTEPARRAGHTHRQADRYERLARTLLTTWADSAACNVGRLHDYANHEYAGLLSAYYYPRWMAYFSGQHTTPAEWFAYFERPFAEGIESRNKVFMPKGAAYRLGRFSERRKGQSVPTALRLIRKHWLLP
ncbi:MAG: alpha-N-acetylglucosaminidase C-terminal domain-containing protein [Alloprevotella sp.]|nr:alpha-N-acetylglucosaminidase C-terminal domain-containing protein [Alloprevotella sp.]